MHDTLVGVDIAKAVLQLPDRLRGWVLALRERAHHNKAAVALANKIARIAWAVSVRDADYAPCPPPREFRTKEGQGRLLTNTDYMRST